MQTLTFNKHGVYMRFLIDDMGRLLLCDVSPQENRSGNTQSRFFTAVDVHTTGANQDDHHGAKHTGSSCPDVLKYTSHEETEHSLIFHLTGSCISVKLIYEFFENTSVIRSYCMVKNISKSYIGLEYVSSFCMYNFNIEKLYIFHNSWCRELNIQAYTLNQLGFRTNHSFSTKRAAVSNTGTWSTKEYLPMGFIEGNDKGILWQIESNGSWNWELSDIDNAFYLKLSGPSEQENGWWKNLKPGESFESLKAAVCITEKGLNGAIEEMTKYRRSILKYPEPALHVIFNDYMECLYADPTTEKELPLIDAAKEAGAEIYCMDAGWYADGTWWETVGEWKVCEKRFPGGMKKVFDYIKSKGMISGIWLEPEVMGINCPILDQFDDTCFFMRHGKRIIDHGRYQLDFRNKKVTDFLDGVVDRLVKEYGIGYFKFDYNIDAGLGTETDADSFGDGLLGHTTAYLNWIDRIYERYPEIIIEHCSSGGMRMDYRSLSHFSLQSLTDASDSLSIARTAYASSIAILPEQAAIWCLPLKTHTLEEIAFCMVNAQFKRIYLGGQTLQLNPAQFSVVKEGIAFYKKHRDIFKSAIPFFPFELNHETLFCCGYTYENKQYYCIASASADTPIQIQGKFHQFACIYPKQNRFSVSINEDAVTIDMGSGMTAGVFVGK